MTSMDVLVCMLCGKGCGEGNQEATVAAMYQLIYQLTHVINSGHTPAFLFFPSVLGNPLFQQQNDLNSTNF